MQVPFFDEKGKELFDLDISDMPHLDACFWYEQDNKKQYYKIIKVDQNDQGKNITYKCTVKPVTEK